MSSPEAEAAVVTVHPVSTSPELAEAAKLIAPVATVTITFSPTVAASVDRM